MSNTQEDTKLNDLILAMIKAKVENGIDGHAWLQDAQTGEVIDPTEVPIGLHKAMRKLYNVSNATNAGPEVYLPYKGQNFRDTIKAFREKHQQHVRYHGGGEAFQKYIEDGNFARPGFCFPNCWYLLDTLNRMRKQWAEEKNPETNPYPKCKLVVGAAGWIVGDGKCKCGADKCDMRCTIHYEWGFPPQTE